MIGAVFRRELQSLLYTPLAWVLLASLQFVAAYVFLIHFEEFLLQQEALRSAGDSPGLGAFVLPRFYAPLAGILLLTTPLLSMRAIAGERSSATLRLLLSAPLHAAEIVLGKFLALLIVLSLAVALLSLMPLALRAFTPIDVGAIAAAALGVWLCGAAGLAVGLYFSSLTTQPLAAAAASFGLLLLLWIIGGGGAAQDELTAVTRFLSLPSHLHSFLSGLLDSRDLSYFVLMIALALALGTRQLAQAADPR